MTKYQASPEELLGQIHQLMDRSSRFLSLSGLSGVAAGAWALVGSALGYLYLGVAPFQMRVFYFDLLSYTNWGIPGYLFFLVLGLVVLVLALVSAVYFTSRKARRKGQKVWDALTWRFLANLFIPLAAGGVATLLVAWRGYFSMAGPLTLLFYGLALYNAGKYTLSEVRYLGLSEMLLGLIGLAFPGYGLELWTIGFGIFHIAYGIGMWYRHERKPA